MSVLRENGLLRNSRKELLFKNVERQLQAVTDPQLIKNGGEMVFDGFLADEQFLGDVPIFVSLDDQLNHFQFATREITLVAGLVVCLLAAPNSKQLPRE